MDDGQQVENNDQLPFYGDHRFLVLIIFSICISITLVVASMIIYNRSGAAQLDLSRPGYKDVRAKAVSKDDSFSNFSATGVINAGTMDSFKLLFAQQATKAKAVDAFSGDPLNPDILWPTINTIQ